MKRQIRQMTEYEPGHGYSRADWLEVSDNPEWTEEDFAKAIPFEEAFPELAATIPKPPRGRPKKTDNKKLVTLRLHPETIEYYRSFGRGWQTMMANDLRSRVAQARMNERRARGELKEYDAESQYYVEWAARLDAEEKAAAEAAAAAAAAAGNPVVEAAPPEPRLPARTLARRAEKLAREAEARRTAEAKAAKDAKDGEAA